MNRILALGTAMIFIFVLGGAIYSAYSAQSDRELVKTVPQSSALTLAVSNEQKFQAVATLPLAAAKVPSPVKAQNGQTVANLPIDDSVHPRLFFDADEIPALRLQVSSTHTEIWTYINQYAKSLVGVSPPTSVPVEQNLETFRVAGNQVIVPAFSCVITQDPSICEGAKTYLLTYAAWTNWDEQNHRDLGLAHMLMGNAIAYDWLYQFLSSDERQFVRENLASWAEKMYEASASPTFVDEWQNWWRISYIQNHYSTNNSALGVVGLVLLGEDVRAATWVAQAQSKMADLRLLLNGIDDGSWHEGIPYQNYQLAMMLPFLVNLERIQGIDLLPHEYLQKFTSWRLYNLLPGSPDFAVQTGNFDAYWSNDYSPQSLLRFMAHEYDDGYAEWTAQQIIANLGRSADRQTMPWYVFELLYYDPSVSVSAPSGLNLSRAFPDHGAVIWRTGWSQNDLVFSLKNGPYGGRSAYNSFLEQQQPWDCDGSGCEYSLGHEHDDNNTFSIWQSGQWLATETIGYDRFETSLHNTILIDGQGQQRTPEGHDASELQGLDNYFEATANTPGFDYLASNATGSYQNIEGIEDFTRYVVFVRPSYFVMLDHMEADRLHDYEWVVHLGGEPDISNNWIRSRAENEQVLGVGIVSPQPFATSSGNDDQAYIRIRPTFPVTETNFINLLYPTDENGWDARPIVALEEDNGRAALIRMQFDSNHRVDDVMIRYDKTPGALELGPYEFDSVAAVVSRAEDGEMQRLFVYGGTFLADNSDSTTLVEDVPQNIAFEASFAGTAVTVEIQGNITYPIKLYAPNVEKLTVNGAPQTFSRDGEYLWIAPWNVLSWPATEGIITPPFVINQESVFQPVETPDPQSGGKATYGFSISQPGEYMISVLVDAPNDGSNSIYWDIDSEPSLDSVWHIETTKGFEERIASGPDNAPKIVRLDKGEHELIIRGREMNTRLRKISLVLVRRGVTNLPIIRN